MSIPISESIRPILEQSGWHPSRDVSGTFVSPFQTRLFPAAAAVLREFGGLHFGRCGPGVDCATSDIELNPYLTAHLDDQLKPYSEQFGTKLFPLGEVHHGHGYLVIDEKGRIYLFSDELEPYAPTFSRGIELLTLGRKLSKSELNSVWGS